jgi:hypothetical protein
MGLAMTRDRYPDFLVLVLAIAGIAFGIGEWIGRTSVRPIERRVEVCSPRSVDAYSTADLRSIAAMRDRLAKVRAK